LKLNTVSLRSLERVENQGEMADAVENAYEAGAKNVRNRLWIDPTLD
jgi:hypothetical protein